MAKLDLSFKYFFNDGTEMELGSDRSKVVAEIAEKFLTKGKEIALEGKLINRSYTDKDGVKKYITEVQVNELLMIGGEKPAA